VVCLGSVPPTVRRGQLWKVSCLCSSGAAKGDVLYRRVACGPGATTTLEPTFAFKPLHSSPPPRTTILERLSQGLKRVFRKLHHSSRPPFTRSVEFPKVALLAHGTRTRP